MKILLTIEDTPKGLLVYGTHSPNGITDNGQQSLSAHLLARIGLMIKESREKVKLVVEGDLSDI